MRCNSTLNASIVNKQIQKSMITIKLGFVVGCILWPLAPITIASTDMTLTDEDLVNAIKNLRDTNSSLTAFDIEVGNKTDNIMATLGERLLKIKKKRKHDTSLKVSYL
jgi:hypothetical protein